MILLIKWRFKGLKGIGMTKEKALWDIENKKEIKSHIHCNIFHYRIKSKRYSVNILNKLAYISNENIILNMPF